MILLPIKLRKCFIPVDVVAVDEQAVAGAVAACAVLRCERCAVDDAGPVPVVVVEPVAEDVVADGGGARPVPDRAAAADHVGAQLAAVAVVAAAVDAVAVVGDGPVGCGASDVVDVGNAVVDSAGQEAGDAVG